MKFTVLGSGTTLPDADRGPAGFLVSTNEVQLLVDGGSGTLQRLMRAGVDPRDLDGGIYSHWHPDHIGDLVPLLFTLRVAGRQRAYPLFAGEGFDKILEGLQGVFGSWIHIGGASPSVTTLSLQAPDRVKIGDLVVRSRPANHSAGALHLSFESNGARVVYSGNTGPSQALTELAVGCDLLVCECAGSDADPIPGHLHPTAVALIAQQARPAQIWLTHLYPQVDPQRAVRTVAATGVPVRHASDLDVWTDTKEPFEAMIAE